MSPASWADSAVPWLAAAWIATVVVAAVLVYALTRAVLCKTSPDKLPEVLRALTPLLNGIAQKITQIPFSKDTDKKSIIIDQETSANQATDHPRGS
jgi:hypothetical protein